VSVAVIGSGFAGVFAAHALAARGLPVEILDVGEELDERRRTVVAKLRDLPPEAWPADDHDLIRGNSTFGKRELPKKMHFGSDYIYACARSFAELELKRDGRAPFPTFARGGFSNIWGAAMLAPDACDMVDWPVSRQAMEPYFRKVADHLPICGGEGTLSQAFPAYRDLPGNLDPGPQGRALIADLQRVETDLLAQHTLYGRPRLAVHTMDGTDALSCTGCGHCFTGCVRGSIFATPSMLEALVRQGRALYRSGLFVESLEERDDKVAVHALDLRAKSRCQFLFDNVFIAAGPINTTRMLLRSRAAYDHELVLKESQKFIVPMLRWHGARTAMEAPAPTLAAAFIETKVPSLSDHWVHVQAVAMNRMLLEGAGIPIAPLALQVGGPLLRRVMMAWCGMHSDHSSEIALRLTPGREGTDLLHVDLRVRDEARAAARRVAKDLTAKARLFRTTLLPRLIRFANPGSGTHCGASFPMRERPRTLFDSDALGRPFGWSRVFAVDSSVLPSIPGTTLAFAVMANAYRIASLAPL
jgi:choline dehydrogenase-like flavoprotein